MNLARNHLKILAGYGLLLSAVLLLPATSFADAKEDKRFRENIRTVLRKHCVSCHNEADKKGGINLDAFDFVVHVVRRGELFEKVIEQVESGAMPPENKPQMSPEETDSLVMGLRRILDNALMDPDPGASVMHRLSHREYQYTVTDLLGAEFSSRDFFPSEGSGGEGFDNQSNVLYITPLMMERYYLAADSLLRQVRQDEGKWRELVPEDYSPGLFRKLIGWFDQTFGDGQMQWDKPSQMAEEVLLPFTQRAYRRLLSSEEEMELMAFFNQIYFDNWKDPQAFDNALATVMKRTMVSPHFLFRYEANQPVDKPYPLSGFELASRLSYLLWSSMPDDTLLNVAYREDLHDRQVMMREVERMMADPKFKRFTSSFAVQWLGVEESLLKPKVDPNAFPELTESIRMAMYEEVVDYFYYVFTEGKNLLDLLDSDYTFLNEELAAHYDLPGVEGKRVRKVSLADSRRGGVLGMGAVLMATSLPLRTSPVLRGQWVLEQLLGDRVPPPPPDVPELEEAKDEVHSELDLRALLEKHREAPACQGCHKNMDPIGLGLENFDAIGRWRNHYGTVEIDASGELGDGTVFSGPGELREVLLEKQDKFAKSISRKVLSYALGRGIEFTDSPTIRLLSGNLIKNDFDSHELIADLVYSYPFRYRRSDFRERYKDI